MIFKLLTYNIWLGGQGRAEKIAHVIASCAPDLVVLQEATKPAVVEEIARLAAMPEWASHERRSLGYLSRHPVKQATWERPRFSQHAFVEIVLEGVPGRVFGVHLSAVHSAWTEQRRVHELRGLLKAVGSRQPGFHVLAGDFNTLAPGATLEPKRLPLRLRPALWASGGRVRWRTIHALLEAGYSDAYRLCHPAEAGYTMPAWDPHVRLDYVFVPSDASQRIRTCDIVQHHDVLTASDHLPLIAQIDI